MDAVLSPTKEENLLLNTHLKALRLPAFLQNYAKLAEEAAQANHSYDRFLLALAELEVAQRERNRIARRIKGARFPVLKELADFDFSCITSPNKQRVLELARGSYIQKAEPILLVGNPGLGKTHIATGLALAACRQGHRVRFYNAAGLVNELIAGQDEHRLTKFLASALRQQLIVLDELGFIPFSPTGAQLIFQFCSSLYERVAMM
jgi:DNA replication protein DnaC